MKGILVTMQSQPDLPKIILALDAVGGFAHFLDCRQQQTGHHEENGDHH